LAPDVRERGVLGRAPELLRIALRAREHLHIGDRDAARVARDPLDRIALPHFARLDHAEVEARASAREEVLGQIRTLVAQRELVTRDAWLARLEQRASDPEAIPDPHVRLEQTARGEVLAECSPRQLICAEPITPV